MKPSARAETLLALVKQHGWQLGAELGVYEGATSDYLLTNYGLLQMVGVDVWQPIGGGPKDKNTGHSPKSAETIRAARERAYAVRERHGALRFAIIEERTAEVPKRFPGRCFDFIFVDASHVTADVVADVSAWYDVVKRGGMILGHDADWPAIQAALAQLADKFIGFDRVQYFPGNVWGVRV
jgi:SAM-dependent methyltransferase